MEELEFWILIITIILTIFIKHISFLHGFCIGIMHYIVDYILQRNLSQIKFAHIYKSLIVFTVTYICAEVSVRIYKFLSKPSFLIKSSLIFQKCPLHCIKKYNFNPFTIWQGRNSIQLVYSVLAEKPVMCSEQQRLASFRGQNMGGVLLARYGFYWDRNTEAVTCYSCGQTLNKEKATSFRGEDVHRPRCRHVVSRTYNDHERQDMVLNTHQRSRPNEPSASCSTLMSRMAGATGASSKTNEWENKSDVDERKATFKNAPWLKEAVTAERLARLGFFCEGSEDVIKCCHCKGSFHHWNGSLLDVIRAHKEYDKYCPFAQLKGI